MGLNNAGIGFSMSMKDTGLNKGLDVATKGFDALGVSIEGIAQKGLGMAASLAKSATRMPDFGPAIGQVQSIAGDFKLTTTSIESFGVAADKTFSASTAGLNLSAKESAKWEGKISSMAYGLNMDVGTVTDAFKALTQSGIDANKSFAGFKNFQEFVKFAAVSNVDVKQLAASVGKMNSQFGMSDADIGDTLKTVVALGTKFNVGSEAAQSMANTVGMLGDEGAALWAQLGPDKTKKFLLGTESLQVAFLKAGHTAAEASDLALGVGQAMIKGQDGVQQLYAGLSEDLPDAMQVLTENLGGAEQAFQTLQSDPATFAKGMAKVSLAIQKTAKSPEEAQMKLGRLNEQLKTTFGPQFVALMGKSAAQTVDVLGSITDELNKPGGLAGKNGALTHVANGYKDGLTYTDRFARAQASFETQLKHTQGVMSDSSYLKVVKDSFNSTIPVIQKLAGDKGLIGKLTTGLIEMSNHGIGGVVAMVSKKYGPAMMQLINQFGPILSQMPAITSAFSALASPIALVSGAIAGLYFYFNKSSDASKKFSDFIDSAAKSASEMFGKIIDAFEKEAPAIFDAVKGIFVFVFDKLKEIDWGKVGGFLYDVGVKLWGILAKGMDAAVKGIGVILSHLGEVLAGLGLVIYPAIVQITKNLTQIFIDFVTNLPKIIVGLLVAVGSIVIGFIDGIEKALKSRFPKLADFFHVIFTGIKIAAIAALGAIVIAAASAAASMIAAFLPEIAIVTAIAVAVYGLVKAIQWLQDKVNKAFDAIGGFFSSIGNAIKGAVKSIVGAKEPMKDATMAVKDHGAAHKQTRAEMEAAAAAAAALAEKMFEERDAARAANKAFSDIKFGTMTGELGAAMKKWEGLKDSAHAAFEEMRNKGQWGKDSADFDKLAEDAQSKGNEIAESLGISFDEFTNLISKTGQVFQFADAQMKELSGLSKDQQNLFEKQRDDQKTSYFQSAADLQKSLDLREISQTAFNQRMDALNAVAAQSNKNLADAIDYAAAKDESKWGTMLSASSQSLFIINKNATAFMDKSNEIFAGQGPVVSKMLAEKAKILDVGYQAELTKLSQQHFKTQAEADKAASDLRDTYLRREDDLRQLATQNAAAWSQITDENSSAAKAVQQSIDNATPNYQGIADAGVKAGSALVDGVKNGVKDKKEELTGVMVNTLDAGADLSDADTSDLLKKIMGIDAKDFKDRVDKINADFHKFLNSSIGEGNKLYTESRKNFSNLFNQQNDAWPKMTGLVNDFISNTQSSLGSFWNDTISKMNNGLNSLLGSVKSMMSNIGSIARNFNLLQAISPESAINEWAIQVVAALQRAFATGLNLAPAIRMASGNFMSELSSLQSQGGNVPVTGRNVEASADVTDFTQQLVTAIHMPQWVEGVLIPEMIREHNALVDAVVKTGQISSGKPAGKYSQLLDNDEVKVP